MMRRPPRSTPFPYTTLFRSAAPDRRVIGVARFSEHGLAARLESHGIETIAADLLDREAVAALPRAANVIFMAGRKFGSSQAEELTWAMNVHVPALVAEAFRRSRIVAFSTGCVYPFVPVDSQGATEEMAVTPPPGEYANSCVGRERMFQYFSERHGTPGCLIRLNYAIEMRYGVLHDVAARVAAGEPVVFGVTPRQPDFAVSGLSASTAYPQVGEAVQFTVTVANHGSDAGAAVPLALVQDGAYGVGETLGTVQVPALAAGAITDVVMSVVLTGNLNLTHTVTAVVNPSLTVGEQDLANNARSLTLGGLPAPGGLLAAIKPTGLPVLLAWNEVNDGRVVGYRVYQAVGDGPFHPIGASPVTGFADLIEAPGYSYRYAVASYAADGSESPLSAPASVTITSITPAVEAPFALYLPDVVR